MKCFELMHSYTHNERF